MSEAPLVRRAFTTLSRLGKVLGLEGVGRLLLFAPIVGVVAGFGAVVFYLGLGQTSDFLLGHLAGYREPTEGGGAAHLNLRWWWLLLVPTIGGLLSGLLVYTFAPEAEGHGTDATVRAFHRHRGQIRARVPVIKTIASILTIGSGGSAGREGPIAQIGAGFGSFLANVCHLTDRERRLLCISGAAAGIGSIFTAPLGGALFGAEVLYLGCEFEFAAILPCVVASIVGYCIFTTVFGFGPTFVTPNLVFRDPRELPVYLLLGLACAGVGFVYVKMFYGTRNRIFRRLPIPNHLKPALGGLGLGLLALLVPQILGGGYGWIQQAINGSLTIKMLALLATAKILATSLTISSGGSGGVFAPSLFIGAMLGGAMGHAAHELLPNVVTQPAAFVLVGMAGLFAGVGKVPISALIMVSEMTSSYGLLVPLMLVCTISYIFTNHWTLYEEQVPSSVDSPAHLGYFAAGVLEHMRVAEAYRPTEQLAAVPRSADLSEIMRVVIATPTSAVLVQGDDGQVDGVIWADEVRRLYGEEAAFALIVAEDLMTPNPPGVAREDSLRTALRLMSEEGLEEIPVYSYEPDPQIVGLLGRRDILQAYDKQIHQHLEGEAL